MLKESIKNVGLQIGTALAPLMQRLAENIQTNLIPKLQRLAEWFNGLSVAQQSFALKAMLVVAALATLTIGIGKLVGSVGNIIKILQQLLA